MSIGLLQPEGLVLNVARGLTWVRETPPGSNRGEFVDQCIKLCGLNPAGKFPWCAAFVSMCGKLALGKKWPLKPWASCDRLFEEGTALDFLRTEPTPGAIFGLFNPDPSILFYHVGFVVERLDDGRYLTAEGNTNTDGSHNGIGVFELKRTLPSDKPYYLNWWS